MTFSEGQTIVHPFHGPVKVSGIRDRVIRGTSVRYLDLDALNHRLSISVPADKAEQVGLRALASTSRVEDLLGILRAPTSADNLGWSRRIKDLQERLHTGDIEQICFVVREISRRGVKSHASAEGQLLRSARGTLVTELSLALTITSEEAGRTIEAALAVGGSPE